MSDFDDLDQVARDLGAAIFTGSAPGKPTQPFIPRFYVGTVSQAPTSTTVQVTYPAPTGGTAVVKSHPYLAVGRNLVVGDVVLVMQLPHQRLVVGAIGSGTTAPTWHSIGAAGEPAFTNSWTNLSGATVARFTKMPDGGVFLQGTITAGSGNAFTLPAGYRPSQDWKVSASGASGNYSMYIVTSAGVITPIIVSGSVLVLDTYFPTH